MSNKRLSELSALDRNSITGSDLFYVGDVSALESKRITATELQGFILSSGKITGSLFGTASYVVNALSASWAPVPASASYALSSSRAISAASATSSSFSTTSSFASRTISASYATSCSFALTSSTQVVVSTTTADTASFLQYTVGRQNGTAVYSLNALAATSSFTASFLSYSPTNGTASHAMTASTTVSSSFLRYDGVTNNGTASYAWTARSASNAATVTTIFSNYLYREFDPLTSSIFATGTTASFGWMQFTGSSGYEPNVIVEAWGDIGMPISASTYSCSLELVMENSGGYYSLDMATFKYYLTASSTQYGDQSHTGSVTSSFYLKGKFQVSSVAQRFSGSVRAYNGALFVTQSRGVKCSIRTTTDNFLDE